jgi:hypothetical protein
MIAPALATHSLEDGKVGVSLDEGGQGARSLIQRPREIRTGVGAQHATYCAYALVPEGRQLLGPCIGDLANGVVDLAHVHSRIAGDESVQLILALERMTTHQQQTSRPIEDAERSWLPDLKPVPMKTERFERH